MDDALLFVYGTLRRGTGHTMARRLADEAEWLGPATTGGKLYRVDWYPALIAARGRLRVKGDLFRLADPTLTFTWLDAYEGCGPDDPDPQEYVRTLIDVACRRRRWRAQTYVWNRRLDDLHPVARGDWIAHSSKLASRPRQA